MKQFEGRSFFIKDEKELEKVRKLIKKSGNYFDEDFLFLRYNPEKEFNHLTYFMGKFYLMQNPGKKNYSISTLQRLLKQC